jgi:hypothetical protein
MDAAITVANTDLAHANTAVLNLPFSRLSCG